MKLTFLLLFALSLCGSSFVHVTAMGRPRAWRHPTCDSRAMLVDLLRPGWLAVPIVIIVKQTYFIAEIDWTFYVDLPNASNKWFSDSNPYLFNLL